MARAGRVQHWKHGWIPLDDFARAQVAARKNRGHIGGATWGASHGGSFRMTGASADVMGIPGYRSFPDEFDEPYIRANATNLLRKIRDAEPRKKSLWHEEAMPVARFVGLRPGATIQLPLTAAGLTKEDASGYGTIRPGDDDGSKVRVMIEFAPGTKAYRYQAGEQITAGAFRVTDIRDDEADRLFDYEKQDWVGQPIKRVVLKQVGVFDPDSAK